MLLHMKPKHTQTLQQHTYGTQNLFLTKKEYGIYHHQHLTNLTPINIYDPALLIELVIVLIIFI